MQWLKKLVHQQLTTLLNTLLDVEKLASGNIRRQELEDYLYKLTQAGRLLDHNLQRAAQLVANFKQVSVDRTADNQRRFNLALYLDELLESLSLMWRSRQIVLRVSCPDDIVMDSYPGTVGQIITNLTQNAIVHGFKDRDSGEINLSCSIKQNRIEIIFADNGAGISSDNLERIFDPFFTTNRHQGGTGLGLSICQRLATLMYGDINVQSQVDQGTEFRVRIPMRRSDEIQYLDKEQLNDIHLCLFTTDLHNQTHLSAYFEYAGAELDVANSFEALQQKAQTMKPLPPKQAAVWVLDATYEQISANQIEQLQQLPAMSQVQFVVITNQVELSERSTYRV